MYILFYAGWNFGENNILAKSDLSIVDSMSL